MHLGVRAVRFSHRLGDGIISRAASMGKCQQMGVLYLFPLGITSQRIWCREAVPQHSDRLQGVPRKAQ